MKVLNYEQGTPEWLASRAGKVTASMVGAVLAAPSTAAYRDYQSQLVAEILTGKPQGSDFTNDYMKYGTEMEPFARAAYESHRLVMVDEVGLVIHPTIDRAGASPDGIVGEGLVEIKCPKLSTHLGYILDDVAPLKYRNQMQWQMACTGAKWVDFVSYRPELPEHLQLFIIRYDRDDKKIESMEKAIVEFLSKIDELLKKLEK